MIISCLVSSEWSWSLRSSLSPTFSAIYRSTRVRLKRNFAFLATFRAYRFEHLALWAFCHAAFHSPILYSAIIPSLSLKAYGSCADALVIEASLLNFRFALSGTQGFYVHGFTVLLHDDGHHSELTWWWDGATLKKSIIKNPTFFLNRDRVLKMSLVQF